MTPDQENFAQEFLVPPPDWPCQWAAEGDAIVWQDGETVVLREELTLVIERLLPSGVPPVGELVLLLAACRGKVLAESLAIDALARAGAPDSVARTAREQLVALSGLPRALLASTPAKTSLASLVLAAAPKLAPRRAAAILAFLQEGLPLSSSPALHLRSRSRFGGFQRALRDLQAGLAPLDGAKIEHALRTGLAEPPAAAEVELPLGEGVRALLRELESDAEFPGFFRLVRDVMAALVLPRALPRPDHDSPGGFSDIGNRGSLHRLLLSELAYDDDTLAARIALGEALYLRREPAANPLPVSLALLLDSGLRMWGTPRVFGTAVALACLAKAPPGHAVETFRADATRAVPISLTSRAGLTAHLSALETGLGPAAALAALLPTLRTADRQLEVTVITHPRTLADLTFHAACLAHRDVAIHAATVDRDGAFALSLCTPGGWQPVAGARLRLEALFSRPVRPAVRQGAHLLPALFRQPEPVFLLPLPRKLKGACEAFLSLPRAVGLPDFAAAISDDGSLWQWNPQETRGALRLPGATLAGEFCGLLFDRTEKCVVAVGHESRGSVLALLRKFGGLETLEVHAGNIPLPIPRPLRIWSRAGHLFLGSARDVHVVNLRAGAVVAEVRLPKSWLWLNDRWLTRPQGGSQDFLTPAFSGTQVVFDSVRRAKTSPVRKYVFLNRCEESEEIWALDQDGRFFDLETGQLKLDPGLGPLRHCQASHDGVRFLARDRKEVQYLIRLPTGAKQPFPNADDFLPGAALPPAWTLRNRFTHICAHPSGRLWLRAARGYWMALHLKEAGQSFALERVPEDSPPAEAVEFGPPEAIPEPACSLSVAEFKKGGRAWLDSRGMLHLQAADLFLPEMTIILAESSSLPIWCADGMSIGPAYFLARPALAGALQIERHLRAFVASCL